MLALVDDRTLFTSRVTSQKLMHRRVHQKRKNKMTCLLITINTMIIDG